MVEWSWWDSGLICKTNWFPSVLWHCWFGHMTCKNRPRYDLCVWWDVKPCSINQCRCRLRLVMNDLVNGPSEWNPVRTFCPHGIMLGSYPLTLSDTTTRTGTGTRLILPARWVRRNSLWSLTFRWWRYATARLNIVFDAVSRCLLPVSQHGDVINESRCKSSNRPDNARLVLQCTCMSESSGHLDI